MSNQATSPTSWAPTAKVSAGMMVGSAAVLILALLQGSVPAFLKDSPEVSAAMTTILTFGIQYWVPERK